MIWWGVLLIFSCSNTFNCFDSIALQRPLKSQSDLCWVKNKSTCLKIRSLTKNHTSDNTLQGRQGLNSDQMEKCEKEKGPPTDQDRDKDKDRGSLEADVRETALARYIVARWKTPRVKLVCSLPFPSLWIYLHFFLRKYYVGTLHHWIYIVAQNLVRNKFITKLQSFISNFVSSCTA